MSAAPEPGIEALVHEVRAALASTPRPAGSHPVGSPAEVATEVRRRAGAADAASVLGLAEVVGAELTGAGRLRALLAAPGVTDVLVNGPREIWVDDGAGLRRVELDLGTEDQVRALAVRLAGLGGRRLDDAAPYVDARLPDGVRLHAVLPPVSSTGTVVSLRIPSRRSFTLDELAAAGSIPPGWNRLLLAMVRRRLSFLVSGGTGSGKTTMLTTLLGCVDPRDRVVLVEDTAELAPSCPHVVRLEARHPNAEGRGEVRLGELVRQALRMRPDRLVVGECRGAEVTDLLAALNTGHTGGCGTVHANAAGHVPARLEALGLLAGTTREALSRQMASGIDMVVHLERRAGLRRVVTLGVLQVSGSEVQVLEAVRAGEDPASPGIQGPGWSRLRELVGDRR